MTPSPIVAADGGWLAHAAYSPASQIRARVWSFAADESIDDAFFARAVERAVAARAPLFDEAHTGVRLVHGESDGLPGVIADRYGDVIVLQCLSAGAERWRDVLVAALAAATGVRCVFERSDVEVRALEGLPARTGVLLGTLPSPVTIREDDLAYRVDPVAGQKTGFYLDQRDNRRLVRELARDRRVLNAFCYSGGFTLAALAGGAAHVTSIDSSADALALGRENVALNPALSAAANTWLEADVFADLRRLRNEGAAFDLIVLDPPKFAPTAAHAERAARAYKDINLLALKLLRSRRAAGDLFVLRRNIGRPVPENRRRRGARRRRCRADPAPAHRQRRPSGRAQLSRGRLSQGPGDPEGVALRAPSDRTFGKQGERPVGAKTRSEGRDST